jgi:hypothetical protein
MFPEQCQMFPEWFAGLTNLRSLNLGWCNNVDDTDLIAFRGNTEHSVSIQ